MGAKLILLLWWSTYWTYACKQLDTPLAVKVESTAGVEFDESVMSPDAEYTWYFNYEEKLVTFHKGKVTWYDGRCRDRCELTSNLQLTIKRTKPSDSGMYHIGAEHTDKSYIVLTKEVTVLQSVHEPTLTVYCDEGTPVVVCSVDGYELTCRDNTCFGVDSFPPHHHMSVEIGCNETDHVTCEYKNSVSAAITKIYTGNLKCFHYAEAAQQEAEEEAKKHEADEKCWLIIVPVIIMTVAVVLLLCYIFRNALVEFAYACCYIIHIALLNARLVMIIVGLMLFLPYAAADNIQFTVMCQRPTHNSINVTAVLTKNGTVTNYTCSKMIYKGVSNGTVELFNLEITGSEGSGLTKTIILVVLMGTILLGIIAAIVQLCIEHIKEKKQEAAGNERRRKRRNVN